MAVKKETEINQEMTLSDVQAQIAKMLADAQAQAEKIVADAVAQAKTAVGTVDDAEREKAKAEDWARGEVLRYKFLDRSVLDHFLQHGTNCCGHRLVKIKIIKVVHNILPEVVKRVLQVAE